MAKDKLLTQDQTTSKNFSFRKGNVSLNFSLRTDIKQELKDFKEILEVAIKAVNDELNAKI